MKGSARGSDRTLGFWGEKIHALSVHRVVKCASKAAFARRTICFRETNSIYHLSILSRGLFCAAISINRRKLVRLSAHVCLQHSSGDAECQSIGQPQLSLLSAIVPWGARLGRRPVRSVLSLFPLCSIYAGITSVSSGGCKGFFGLGRTA